MSVLYWLLILFLKISIYFSKKKKRNSAGSKIKNSEIKFHIELCQIFLFIDMHSVRLQMKIKPPTSLFNGFLHINHDCYLWILFIFLNFIRIFLLVWISLHFYCTLSKIGCNKPLRIIQTLSVLNHRIAIIFFYLFIWFNFPSFNVHEIKIFLRNVEALKHT